VLIIGVASSRLDRLGSDFDVACCSNPAVFVVARGSSVKELLSLMLGVGISDRE
jgi:hypothetical protein